jgi:SAM-dependent methyltransferase
MSLVIVILAALVLAFGFVVFFGAPYVPSHRSDLDDAFDTLYKVTSRDLLLDLGSGDGIVLRAAARRGASAVGFELNPLLVAVSRLLSRRYPKVTVRPANMWREHFPERTTLVYAFAVHRDVQKLADKLQHEANRLQRPLHFISYGFEVPTLGKFKKTGAHFLYTVTPLQAREA